MANKQNGMGPDIVTSTVKKVFEELGDQFGSPKLDAESLAHLGHVLGQLPVFVSITDDNDHLIYASPSISRLEGVEENLSEIKTGAELFPSVMAGNIGAISLTEAANCSDLTAKHKDGSIHIYQISKSIYEVKNKKLIYTVGLDVTDQRLAENALKDQKSRLNYMVFHDPLTGLANRSLFYEQVNEYISDARKKESHVALLLIDLDRFKMINDSLGHDAGDTLLQKLAEALKWELRESDTIARLGGDEFVVILDRVRNAEDAEMVADKLLNRLAAPINIHGHVISTTASIGISMYPDHGDCIDKLLKHADVAMYTAKALGKNRHQLFNCNMKDAAVDHLMMENDLRHAIERNEMQLYYQPQIDLKTGRIIGLEALVRWVSEERGMVSPAHFIPVAEETGYIDVLGKWVLQHACDQFSDWQKNGLHYGKVAVNLSAKQFRQKYLDQMVRNALLKSHLEPKYLELEITESSVMDNVDQTIDSLQSLHKMGLSLAIDDFGTGYSCLSYLKRFPIQKLKIDRSFVQDVDNDESDAAIAKSIIDLARNMSLQVIAEGVERPTQSKWLVDRGCDQVQGFYYAKPMPADQLLDLTHSDLVKVTGDGVNLKI